MTPSPRSRQKLSAELPQTLQFEGIGTHWSIDTAEVIPAAIVEELLARVESFDRAWSRFRDDSLVSRIASTPGRHPLPAEAGELLALYRSLYELTDGAVTPLVGRALENLGYDSAYSLRPRGIALPVPRWEDAIAWDGEALTTLTPVVLDVGAAGKGFLADLLGGILRQNGIDSYLVDGSGDLVHRGEAPVRVALEHPLDTSKAVGIANLRGGALCASASNRRTWGPGLHHVIEPSTGLPTERVIATWVLAESGLLADGLATALFFSEAPALRERFDFSYVRMFARGRLEYSPDFDGEIFT